ncbi:MAG TPA: DNA-3-methyladenine glycosylase 2 family protein [Anaerolineae bacterium]|nr:DNA-3-methyladenine glycosylase 2 family protein [Anaerolineae bacterium]
MNETSLLQAVRALGARDPHLAGVVARFGPPPLWARDPGFATLVHIILEQQVSLASARSAFEKLVQATGSLTPASLLELSDAELKSVGFSRQKTAYARDLAGALLDGRLDLSQLPDLDDHQARAQLMGIKGIGPWTADIYLLMALGRPDIWPSGDLALAAAVQRVQGLATRPSSAELLEISFRWRPWRAVAARILWHFYLSVGLRAV